MADKTTEPYATLTTVDDAGNINMKELSYSDVHMSPTEILFEQLRELTSRWNDHEDIQKSQQAECKAIGEKLNMIGGMPLMTEAYRFAKSHNNSVHVIQAYWHGVGDWQW